jgi:four helix bundle protein
MGTRINSHKELRVFQNGMDAAMEIFRISKRFPADERYSLTDQIRKASRSVCANVSEAWRKRRYKAAFESKLNDAESEATETQVWLEFAVRSGYLERPQAEQLDKAYDLILAQLVTMIRESDKWIIKKP